MSYLGSTVTLERCVSRQLVLLEVLANHHVTPFGNDSYLPLTELELHTDLERTPNRVQSRNRQTLPLQFISAWRRTSHENRGDLGPKNLNHRVEEGLGNHSHLPLGVHLSNQPRKDPEEIDQEIEVLFNPPELSRRLLTDLFGPLLRRLAFD